MTRAGLQSREPASGPMRSQAGFTLLEVLIALALLAVIASAVYGTYFTLFKGKETTIAGMEERRALRETLDTLRRELSGAWFRSNNQHLRFAVEDRDHFGKPASRLAFATMAPPAPPGMPVSDQVAVTYSVVEKGEQLTLARSSQGVQLDEEPLDYPQMENIEGFLVECSADGSKWVRSWDTGINGTMPKAVRVTLQLRENGRTVGYTTMATIRIANP